jgi:PAS domain S-box-containing protein
MANLSAILAALSPRRSGRIMTSRKEVHSNTERPSPGDAVQLKQKTVGPQAGHACERRRGDLAFSALADNVRDYTIFLTDAAGVITYWGKGARLMTWWTEEQAEGAHLRLLYPDNGSEDGTAEEHLTTAAATGEYAGEGQRVRSDGSTFWAGVTLTALRDDGGALIGFTKVTRDLTAPRAADAAKAASVAAEHDRLVADEANRATSRFLASMSHEIRTPINAVLGYIGLLEETSGGGTLDATQRQYVERLRICGSHLAKLIDGILDLSRLEGGGIVDLSTPVRLGAAIAGALAIIEPQARASGLVLTNDLSAAVALPLCHGDEHSIRQILVNVLANAIKFTNARDGQPGHITVSAGAANEPPPDAALDGLGPWVYVRVEDNGRGIPADQLGAIFDAFVQVDADHMSESRGAGLGLAISRRLARLMAGDLTAQSTPGVGSAFLLWLGAAH